MLLILATKELQKVRSLGTQPETGKIVFLLYEQVRQLRSQEDHGNLATLKGNDADGGLEGMKGG